jgi:hypothetical protein
MTWFTLDWAVLWHRIAGQFPARGDPDCPDPSRNSRFNRGLCKSAGSGRGGGGSPSLGWSAIWPVANVVPCTQFEAYPFKRPNRRETQSFVKSGARRVWQDDSGESAVKSL